MSYSHRRSLSLMIFFPANKYDMVILIFFAFAVHIILFEGLSIRIIIFTRLEPITSKLT